MVQKKNNNKLLNCEAPLNATHIWTEVSQSVAMVEFAFLHYVASL